MKLAAGVVGALLLAGVLAWGLSRQHAALQNALADGEAAKLALAHQIVAHEETRRQLQGSVDGLLSQNAQLRQAVDDARVAAPSAKVVGSAILATKAVKLTPPSAPAPVSPPLQAVKLIDTNPPESCVLQASDTASVQVEEVALRTQDGNLILAGVAELWRESPLPRWRLMAEPFQAALSDASALAPPAEPRWGVGIALHCAASGCAPGVGVLFPSTKVLGVRLEGSAALTGPLLWGVSGLLAARF